MDAEIFVLISQVFFINFVSAWALHEVDKKAGGVISNVPYLGAWFVFWVFLSILSLPVFAVYFILGMNG